MMMVVELGHTAAAAAERAVLNLRAQEVRQRSFLWWCAPSNKDYNTADEDQKDKIIQDLWHRGKTYQ